MAKADYERLAEFRYLLRRFSAFSEAAAETAGLTPQQHQAMLAVKGYPGRDWITIGELAGRLCLRHHSTVELIDRLAAKGLVVRQSAEHDKRQVLVGLTEDGEISLEKLSVIHRAELERLTPQLHDLLAEFRSASENPGTS